MTKGEEWKEKTFYVTDITDQFYIAFYAGTAQSASAKNFYIDHFRIDNVPDCPEPYEVQIVEATQTSLEVEWQQYGDISTWEVIILPASEEFPADESELNIVEVEGEPNVIFEDLDSATMYKIYVRTVCTEESEWTNPIQGGTLPTNDECVDAINIPVNEGAECEEFVSGTIAGATLSEGYETPDCMWDDPVMDVWFEFTATEELLEVSFDNFSSDSTTWFSMYVAVYQGVCDDMEEIYCDNVGTWNTYFRLEDLEIGETYYIRVLNDGGIEDMFFDICITTPLPPIRTSESGNEYTVEELVKDILITAPCDLVSNISYRTGTDFVEIPWWGGEPEVQANGIGYFDKNGSIFEFEDGIILATNGVQYAPGPGNSDEGPGNGSAWLGDDDLEDILIQNGQFNGSNNASVLEFDFIPVTDTISFDFIFASNEYGTFQCSFADVFAFLLTDLQTGATTNLAVIPETNIPVSVVTIRKEEHSPEDWLTGEPECGDSNPEYFDKYYDDDPDFNGLPPRQNPINYKGMTIPMQAVSAVVPGRKYHIKLAIADYGDTSVNSAVFLRGGSFDLGTVDFGEDLTVEDNNALCEEGTYTLDSGLNPEWVEISWYKDDVLIPGAEDPVYEVTEPGEYTVVGRYTAVEDSDCEVEQSIKIEFYPTIKETLQQPEGVDYCRNSLEDTMDLTVVEEGMFSGVGNKGDYSIEYYESEADREAQENAIVSPSEFAIPGGTTKTIYIHVINTVSGCEGDFEFTLNPVAATIPANPGDKQVCAVYEFPELPDNQYYYSGSKATGTAYKAGDVLEDAGSHEIYIYSISANGKCYEEISYTVRVTAPVEGYELDDVELQCENYILPALPEGSAYYTLSGEEGDKLEAGDEVRLAQTIYIFTKSAEGPDYCTAETSFTVDYKDCPLPKGFSPNGDGVNDYLDLGIYGVTGIKVYNRNGVEVFSQGVYNSEWNGQDKSGNALPSGTYYYVIESHGKIKTGWIQISR
jgi:gliding motility-associated-like protein